jgi:hypothetical protein
MQKLVMARRVYLTHRICGDLRFHSLPGDAEDPRRREERLDWLAGLIDPDLLLEGVAHTKLRQFAAEAARGR